MPVTYDPSLSDKVSEVRLYMGDTVEGKGPRPEENNFTDEEIQALLGKNHNSIPAVVAVLFDVLAAEWAKLSITFTEGPRKEELYRISTRFESKSREWSLVAGTTNRTFSAGVKRRENAGA